MTDPREVRMTTTDREVEAPVRVQLRRTEGWRMPENTVSVARPGRWGNPYIVVRDEMRWDGETVDDEGDPVEHGPWLCRNPGPHLGGWWFPTKEQAVAKAVEMFRWRLTEPYIRSPMQERISELRGKNLACWCPLDQPCHADVLLDLASQERDKA